MSLFALPPSLSGRLLYGAAALSGFSALGHTQMGFEIMPNIRDEQRPLRALRGLWYQGSAWFLFVGLQLLRWSKDGGVRHPADKLALILLQAIDAFYVAFYLRLGYKPPLLAYGGRLGLTLGATYLASAA